MRSSLERKTLMNMEVSKLKVRGRIKTKMQVKKMKTNFQPDASTRVAPPVSIRMLARSITCMHFQIS